MFPPESSDMVAETLTNPARKRLPDAYVASPVIASSTEE
jgi:hypothetical protein